MQVPVAPRPPDGSSFWRHLDSLLPIQDDALDLGTGTGRVALHVAAKSRTVVGVDINASSLEAARWDAKRRGITNVRFVEANAETADLLAPNEGTAYELVTARLFLSMDLVSRMACALAPGGHLLIEALEGRHWQEAGGSRFNLAAEEVRDAVASQGLHVVDARVETEHFDLADARAAENLLKERRLWTKWKSDGRWERLKASLRKGSRGLTEAYLVLWARRPSG